MTTDKTDRDKARTIEARRLEELDDFNNSRVGRENGRLIRFGGKPRQQEALERKRAEQTLRDALDLMLQDAEYRARYEHLGDRLSDAETTADHIIAELHRSLQDAADTIADMEDRAAKTLDGTPVFRTADGLVVDAEGRDISPEIAAGIVWPDDAPSAEDYFAARTRHTELAAHLEAWDGYRTDTLGGIRDRYDDRDNPQTLEGLEADLELIAMDAPDLPSGLSGMEAVVDVPTLSTTLIPTLPGL